MTTIKFHHPQLCRWVRKSAFASVLALASFCVSAGVAPPPPKAADVDDARIIANAQTGKEWPSNALDYQGTRFSQLKKINTSNVEKLGLAWSYDLGSTRGVEATPIVVDGVMYVSAPWAIVHAIDARTGKRLWTYDPKTPRSDAWKACCDVVNRGVAVYKGKVYVSSLDARLVAIDAATGNKVWEADTKVDKARKFTLTAAPYIARDKVIIGTAGGEYGVRGYVSAYDSETGALKWRWFTTPGDPSKPFEDESQAKAAKTWDPSTRYWENGGGGTVWNSMAIDPELKLVYFGTGNAGPWARSKRGKVMDNLYTASIVALNIDTGKYAWHFQENPSDAMDFDSVMDLIVTDLKIGNKMRKVIMHAPKNGFFYVIDRTNGKFISGKPFAPQTWALGLDKNGRPIENPAGIPGPDGKGVDVVPSVFGAHNYHAMSFSPLTGLTYFAAQHVPLVQADSLTWSGQDSYKTDGAMEPMGGIGWNLAAQFNERPPKDRAWGHLLAWDPKAQKPAWSYDLGAPWNSGTMVTAGNLVFIGTADARFAAFNATSGKLLWETQVGSGVSAAPVTYELDGKQYVSIPVGWGGVYGQTARHSEYKTKGRVYTFVLDGKAEMPPFEKYDLGPLIEGVKYDPKDVPAGTALFVSHCVFCHGVPGVAKGGNIANLGYVNKELIENLDKVLFDETFMSEGMPDYKGKLTARDVEKLKAFIQGVPDSIRPKSQ